MNLTHQLLRSAAFWGLLLISTAGGCAAIREKTPSPLRLQGYSTGLTTGDIVATRSGSVISFENLMDDLLAQQVIFVGETHVSVADHGIQLRILEALHAKNTNVALAMEMFPRSVQPVLDRWSAGSLDQEQFLREAKWQENWGYPFFLYSPLLLYCRDNHLPVIGLNAPPALVREVAREGLAHLKPDDRAQLAEHFDFTNSVHRKAIHEVYEQHVPAGIASFDTFYEAQLAWEETMAETLAGYLVSHSPREQVLVIIGNGHIEYRSGVPQRASARFPHAYRTIVTIPSNSAERSIDPEVADYVWITPEMQPFHVHRGRLGIRLETQTPAEGLRIVAVLPDSPAARAGLREGDILLRVNDHALTSLEDIHRALEALPQEAACQLVIRRDGMEQAVTVEMSKE
jgi:uncharacterized iron-regulated protein